MCQRRKDRSRLPRKLADLLFLGVVTWLLFADLAQAQTWNLQWNDEFNGAPNTPIGATKWTFETGIFHVNNDTWRIT